MAVCEYLDARCACGLFRSHRGGPGDGGNWGEWKFWVNDVGEGLARRVKCRMPVVLKSLSSTAGSQVALTLPLRVP